MRLRRLCLEIFALRRFFKEPIAGVSVCRASEAQPKHRLSEIANAFGAKSRGFPASGLPAQPARAGEGEFFRISLADPFGVPSRKNYGQRDGDYNRFTHETRISAWSGWWDLNPRPLRPERSALPS